MERYIVDRDGQNWAVFDGVTGEFIADYDTREDACRACAIMNRLG